MGFSPGNFYLSIGVSFVQLIYRKSCFWDCIGVVSDISRIFNLISRSLTLWLLQFSHLPPHNVQWTLSQAIVLKIYLLGLGSTRLHFWLLGYLVAPFIVCLFDCILFVFLNNLHLLQRDEQRLIIIAQMFYQNKFKNFLQVYYIQNSVYNTKSRNRSF